MSQSVESRGSWFPGFVKALGIVAVIGILIAVGAIVMKVFTEQEGSEPDAPNGV